MNPNEPRMLHKVFQLHELPQVKWIPQNSSKGPSNDPQITLEDAKSPKDSPKVPKRTPKNSQKLSKTPYEDPE